MTRKTFYEKVGRRYVPVREYDSELHNAYPRGTHVTVVTPGVSSTRYNIDPDYAALIAASMVAYDHICKVIVDHSRLKPTKEPITREQKELWDQLSQSLDISVLPLYRASVAESVRVGTDAMIREADKLMQHDAVRQAYEHFITIAKLCSNQSQQ